MLRKTGIVGLSVLTLATGTVYTHTLLNVLAELSAVSVQADCRKNVHLQNGNQYLALENGKRMWIYGAMRKDSVALDLNLDENIDTIVSRENFDILEWMYNPMCPEYVRDPLHPQS